MMATGLDQAIEFYHQALTDLIKGNPDPQKERFSHRDDVCLANPFGPAIRGWAQVDVMLDDVASMYSDAGPKHFERVTTYVTTHLACIVEIERAWVTMRGRQERVQVVLRVTTIFRLEGGDWKVVHRHADGITTPRPPEAVVQR